MPSREEIAKRKEKGLCTSCGSRSRPPREGKTACQSCADKQAKIKENNRCVHGVNNYGTSCVRCHPERTVGRRLRARRQLDHIFARIGLRRRLPEWKIRQIEATQKLARELYAQGEITQ